MITPDPADTAQAIAEDMLRRLGIDGCPDARREHPALAWRRAGLMDVTGFPDGPGLVCPVALTSLADGLLAALVAISDGQGLPTNGALLLGERCRLLGLRRRGAISANESCRLLATRDGRIALNLPREDDWELLPALLGEEVVGGWEGVAAGLAAMATRDVIERGRLLGLGIAEDRCAPALVPPFEARQFGPGRSPRGSGPLIVDLSPLWAGPLAASLMGMAGGRVIKVESAARPDGGRLGHAGFYDLLNAGKAGVALDFRDGGDVDRLRGLLDRADIVIEGSRPRALEQLGISAADHATRGASWISITAHGRSGDAAGHAGFGDDCAVAGGLATAMEARWGRACFVGDAIADPLAGMMAALAGWASWRNGGGRLLSVSLAGITGFACGALTASDDDVAEWQAMVRADRAPLHPLRAAAGKARPFGADTDRLVAQLT